MWVPTPHVYTRNMRVMYLGLVVGKIRSSMKGVFFCGISGIFQSLTGEVVSEIQQ